MENKLDNIYTWQLDSAAIILRYVFLAGSGYAIFYVWRYRNLIRLKIQKERPSKKIVLNEIFYSAVTLAIYCATSWFVFYWEKSGYTKIYRDIHQYSIAYFIFSILLMVILHDAYFYWTHRLMHLPKVFGLIHKVHHLSNNPTPWASFSFHPLEAIISAGIIPIIVFFLPCHPLALFLFLSLMTIINVIGHLGYETFPAWMKNGRLGKWPNNSTNHNVHHQHAQYNFGLYFTFWDRVMNTYRNEG